MSDSHASYSLLQGPEVAASPHSPPSHLVVFLHGLGADGFDLIGLAKHISDIVPNPHCIAPNAPFGCDMSPFGYQWFSLFDRSETAITDGIREATPYLQKTIDFHLHRLKLTTKDLILVGFSQGTMVALHYGLHYQLPCTIIGFSGMLVDPPHTVDAALAPHICLIHGEQDEVIAATALEEAATQLAQLNIVHQTHMIPQLGHHIDPTGLAIATSFIQKRIKTPNTHF